MAITRIIYDVTEAIANLKKLDRQTGKTGKKTKDDFDKGSKGLKQFNDTLGKISPRAGDAAKAITNLGTKMGPLAGGLAIVGAAVAGVIAELVPYNDLMRDARKSTEEFIRTSKQASEARNLAAQIQSAGTFAQLEGKSLEARAERSRITQNQIQVAGEIESSRARLREVDKFNRDVESKLRASIARQREIKAELGDSSGRDAISQATRGTTAGRGVLNLADRAQQEALKGNTKLAKELTEEARSRAAELGNHVLFINRIEQAEGQIKAQLQEQLKEQEAIEKSERKRLDNLKKIKEQETGRLEGLQGRQADLTRRKANLESVENDINRAKELDNAATKATTALNNWTQSLAASKKAIDVVANPDPRTQKAIFQDRVKALTPGGKTQRDVLGENRAITQLGQNIAALRDQLERDPSSAADVATGVGRQLDLLSALRESAQGRALSPAAQNRSVDAERAAKELLEAAKAQRDSVEAGKGRTGTPQEIEKAVSAGAEEGLKRALSREIGRTELPDVARPSVNAGASTGGGGGTVNVNIQGGMLDDETMRQIEERIKRMLREEKISPQNVA
jgi:hypothetical protein